MNQIFPYKYIYSQSFNQPKIKKKILRDSKEGKKIGYQQKNMNQTVKVISNPEFWGTRRKGHYGFIRDLF